MRLRRILFNKAWLILTILAMGFAIVPLVAIIVQVALNGIPSLSIDFFTHLPPTPYPSPGWNTGGLGNAIQGTLILVALSSAIGIPIGIVSGIYVSEYGRNAYGSAIGFLGEVLAGIPSIVTGILVYTLIVVPLHGYSVIAGSIALGSMMIPIVSNTSGVALKAVPNSIREAAHGLGVKKWRTTLLVTVNARKSIATASLLAVARITGETAPLIMTAGISGLWYRGLNKPIATLTYYVYYYALSPYSNYKSLAWGAAFILIVIVMGINIGVRLLTREKKVYA